MANLFNNIFQKIPKSYKRIALESKYFSQKVLFRGKQIGEKGKIQIELEKLRWELRKKYQELGKYITQKKETKSIIDFSHDQECLKQINDIIKLKIYVAERTKVKKTL